MKYVLEKKEERIFSYLLDESGHAVEIRADRENESLKLGDIVVGRVASVAKNIHAAFVALDKNTTGYLPLEEIVGPIYSRKGPSKDIQQGDELVVQISREAFGKKAPSLTTKLTLKGRLIVLESGGMGVGVSKKIPEEKRKEVRDSILSSEEYEQVKAQVGQCGIIVRTNAVEEGKEQVLRELSDLEGELLRIRLSAPYRTIYSVLRREPPLWLRRLDSLPLADTESVITEDEELYRQMKEYLRVSAPKSPLREKLRLYHDDLLPLSGLFSLERELKHALDTRVNMNSGAYLVIQTTEALHAIDVNSGRFEAGKEKEQAVLRVNLEAADIALKQIRLRNLSGMILIDFINMEEEESQEKLMERLRKCASRDPVHTQIIDRTKLGLVEITRKKIEVSLAESLRKDIAADERPGD